MPVVLKLKHQGEVRRTQLRDGEVTHDLVREEILKVWPELGAAVAKYADEEGDLCVLCPASFSDWLCQAQGPEGQRLLKLELMPRASPRPAALEAREPEVQSPAPASPATPEVGEAAGTRQTAQQPAQGEGAWPWSWDVPWADHGAAPWQRVESGLSPRWGGWLKGSQEWLLKPTQVLWMLAGLRATDGLSGKSAVSLVVHFLPRVISNIAERPEKVEWALRASLPRLRPLLEDLRELASRTPGLEQCSPSLGSMLVDEGASRTEAVLSLLLALSQLSFEMQVAFAEEFYNSRHAQELLDWVRLSAPTWAVVPLEHGHVACDSCGVSPLRGLRFQCQTCADYDLCGECFVKKGTLHGGECADHEFQCTFVDWGFMWKTKQEEMAAMMPAQLAEGMTKGFWVMEKARNALWGKGEGKGMGWLSEAMLGRGAGMRGAGAPDTHNADAGRGIGAADSHGGIFVGREAVTEPETTKAPAASPGPSAQTMLAEPTEDAKASDRTSSEVFLAGAGRSKERMPVAPPAAQQKFAALPEEPRPCPGGCGFQATWHPTHCCNACKLHGGHGPACQQRPAAKAEVGIVALKGPADGAGEPGGKSAKGRGGAAAADA